MCCATFNRKNKCHKYLQLVSWNFSSRMKPVPRSTRSKRYHRLNAEPERSDKLGRKWHREEKKKLVIAMKRLNTRTAGGKTGIDCAFLRKYVLSRSVSEVGLKYIKISISSIQIQTVLRLWLMHPICGLHPPCFRSSLWWNFWRRRWC